MWDVGGYTATPPILAGAWKGAWPLKAQFAHRPHCAPSSGFNCELRRYCAASDWDDDRYRCLCPAARVARLHSDLLSMAPNAEAIHCRRQMPHCLLVSAPILFTWLSGIIVTIFVPIALDALSMPGRPFESLWSFPPDGKVTDDTGISFQVVCIGVVPLSSFGQEEPWN